MARDDDRDVIVVEKDGGGGLKWLLVGAAVGAGLALLFAPKSGKEMRRGLEKSLRNLRDMADETIDELRGERGTEEHDLRSMADQTGAYEDGDHEVVAEPIRRKDRPSAVSAREELERRLAAARARRRSAAEETADDEEPVA